EDRTVSRLHAQLRWVNGGWVLSDLGSMNGTWVNGWRIDEAWIRDGDRVQLGAVEVRFRAR
ncbi:MAG TPA: FHA domain-containing protein, partial [Kofleriaceae bacterium]|nr:FHA domain-containing protein [Kofleriaceae bacterium]